ncbi:mechanosensitive ion channel family protein [Parerythrobacter aurantius]|uniref:mechanosensitive ion channel domain-containing protein n=1 Tax=Parerythrobacter aurantius TaxID=3127706 RepID=UPI00324CED57
MRAPFFVTLLSAMLAVATFPAAPAFAALPIPSEAEAPQPAATERAIAQDTDGASDIRIAQRIRGIFGEIPSLQGVEVSVSDGVVTLEGMVTDEGAATQAESIAGRIDSVVTVQNRIERDTSVEGGLDALGNLSERVQGWAGVVPLAGLALLVALLIGALGYVLASFTALWRRITPNSFLAELVASAIRFVFVVLGLVIALDMLGAGALLGAVLGGAGVIGIALGFAMRDTIENYVASLMLSLRQPFRANDHVLIGDKEGRVIRLTSRATVLMTLDGNHLRIPNSQVFKAVILNYTTNPQRRFDFELGIDADDDPRSAMKLGIQTLAGLPFVLAEPEPSARIRQVGDSNIVLLFLGWVDQRESDWFKSRSMAIAAVKEALEDHGFAMPEPIYRLRFDSRTDPLPIGRAGGGDEKPEQTRSRGSIAPETNDVRPEREIAEMVDEERRGDGGQADDLLDNRRPVE